MQDGKLEGYENFELPAELVALKAKFEASPFKDRALRQLSAAVNDWETYKDDSESQHIMVADRFMTIFREFSDGMGLLNDRYNQQVIDLVKAYLIADQGMYGTLLGVYDYILDWVARDSGQVVPVKASF